MYPASGLLFGDDSGVRKTASYKNTRSGFLLLFSGIGFHLPQISLKGVPPVWKRSESIGGKLGLIES